MKIDIYSNDALLTMYNKVKKENIHSSNGLDPSVADDQAGPPHDSLGVLARLAVQGLLRSISTGHGTLTIYTGSNLSTETLRTVTATDTLYKAWPGAV